MVLPVHDVNPTRRTPYVTYLLIVANVVVFLMSPLALAPLVGDAGRVQQCAIATYLARYAVEPAELVTGRPQQRVPTPVAAVERRTGRVGCVAEQPPSFHKSPFLSVLTAMFLHGGWLHLLGNMLFLYVFGNNVEDRLGRLRFLVFYLFCGYAATYGFALFQPTSTEPLVGASGAIAGVLGAYLVMFPRAKVWSLLTFLFFLPVRLPAWLVLGSWFVLQYAYVRGAGLARGSGVAYGAHVVGFLVGAALAWRSAIPRPPASPARSPAARRARRTAG
ncbi:MAG: rhomboid family intramembrane serine protease [Actinomycetota bacterium]|nr:rhomboid family intramembrane serine protease [Actinomycetota bacterium]